MILCKIEKHFQCIHTATLLRFRPRLGLFGVYLDYVCSAIAGLVAVPLATRALIVSCLAPVASRRGRSFGFMVMLSTTRGRSETKSRRKRERPRVAGRSTAGRPAAETFPAIAPHRVR